MTAPTVDRETGEILRGKRKPGDTEDGQVWTGAVWLRLPEVAPDGIPSISDELGEADIVALIPTYLRDVKRSIRIEQGRQYTPDDIVRAQAEISDRLDNGDVYLAALHRAQSEAREILDLAEAEAMDTIVAECEARGVRPPAEDIRKARVMLRTTRQREQHRRLKLLLDLSERRMKHLRSQSFIAASMGANVRVTMGSQPGWSS